MLAFTPEQREKFIEQATPGVLFAFHEEMRQRCARDGLFWLRFVKTRDEADPETPEKPFPLHFDYVRDLWQILVARNRVVIAKSRQMLVSWLLCAFVVWWARFHENQAVYWQTQKAEDSWEKVALPTSGGGYTGRCQFIEAHLPGWLQVKCHPSQGQIIYPNGSGIFSLPGGADQIRGKVASVIVEDEFAFQPEAHGVWTACAPLIQKGAKFIAASTPNGADNQFAKLYFGTA